MNMRMRQEWHLCKLHNEVFKSAESRINTECPPLVGGDESGVRREGDILIESAPRGRG